MPIDYKLYPANWKTEIRPAVLERAKNCCEICGVPNYSVGYWDKAGKFWTVDMIMSRLEDNGYDIFDTNHELGHHDENKKCVKVVLTIMHLDHDITNNSYDNLKAGCQLCHNRYDSGHRKYNRLKNKGVQNLF